MKKTSALFFQIVTVLFGLGVFIFMLWEPHLEGRNINATLFQIYFNDPFLAYAYIASIPFFVALYHIFKVLGYFKYEKVFPPAVVKSLQTIKYCSMAIIAFVMLGEIFIMLGDSDDRAGGVFIGFLIILVSIVFATVAEIIKRRYKEAN